MSLTVFGLSNPAHARYALPLLALSCGLVVLALASRTRWLSPAAIGLGIIVSVVGAWPQLGVYRQDPSPPVRAVHAAVEGTQADGACLVADRSLLSFVEYERLSTGRPVEVFNDLQIETGAGGPKPEDRVVAVYDRGRGRFVVSAEEEVEFSSDLGWLRRLGQDRFLDLTVAIDAQVASSPSVW